LRDLPMATPSERRPAVPSPAQVFTFMTHPRRSAPTPEDQAALAGAERIDVRHRGTKLAVWSWGHGLPVLLLHGWESQASDMAAFVGPLLQAGFRHRALILHDPNDREMPYAESVALAKAWQGSTLEPVAGVGHRRIVREPSVVESVVRFVMDARAGT
jgi:pimeloyl-ACP methyl ester carboxylesterase